MALLVGAPTLAARPDTSHVTLILYPFQKAKGNAKDNDLRTSKMTRGNFESEEKDKSGLFPRP